MLIEGTTITSGTYTIATPCLMFARLGVPKIGHGGAAAANAPSRLIGVANLAGKALRVVCYVPYFFYGRRMRVKVF